MVMVLRGINYFMSCGLKDDIWQQNAALLGGDNVTVLERAGSFFAKSATLLLACECFMLTKQVQHLQLGLCAKEHELYTSAAQQKLLLNI